MQDVFVSYKRADQVKAKEIVRQLEALGVSCFIDERNTPAGSDWNQTIDDAIRGSKAVLVVWSKAAIVREPGKVSYVIAEANKGRELGKLVATSLSAPLDLPTPFNIIQAPNIGGFLEEPRAADPNWQRVLMDLGAKIDRSGLNELALVRDMPDDLERARNFVRHFAGEPKAEEVWAEIEDRERRNFEARWNAARSQLAGRARKTEGRLRKCRADFEAWLAKSRDDRSGAAAPDPSRYLDVASGEDRIAALEEIAADAERALQKAEAARSASSTEADGLRRDAQAASEALAQALAAQRSRRRNKVLAGVVGALAGGAFALAVIYLPWSRLETERQDLLTKLREAQAQIADLTQDRDRQLALSNQRQTSLDGLKAQYASLSSERDGLQATIADLRAKVEGTARDLASLAAERDELLSRSKALQSEIARVPDTTKELEARIEALDLELAKAREAAEKAASVAKAEIDRLTAELPKARKSADDASVTAKAEIDRLTAELSKARKSADDASAAAKTQIDQLTAELSKARKSADDASAAAKMQNDLLSAELSKARKSADDASAAAKAQIDQLTAQLSTSRKSADDASAAAKAQIGLLTAEFNAARKSADESQGRLQRVGEHLQADRACTEKSGGKYDFDNLSDLKVLDTNALEIGDIVQAMKACQEALDYDGVPKWDRRRLNAQLGRLAASLAFKMKSDPGAAKDHMAAALAALKLAADDNSVYAWQLLGGYWGGVVGIAPDEQDKSENLKYAFQYYGKAAQQRNVVALVQLAMLLLNKDVSMSSTMDQRLQEARNLIALADLLGYGPAPIYRARLELLQVQGNGPTPSDVLTIVDNACSSSDDEVKRAVKVLLSSFAIRQPGGERRKAC